MSDGLTGLNLKVTGNVMCSDHLYIGGWITVPATPLGAESAMVTLEKHPWDIFQDRWSVQAPLSDGGFPTAPSTPSSRQLAFRLRSTAPLGMSALFSSCFSLTVIYLASGVFNRVMIFPWYGGSKVSSSVVSDSL